MEDKLEPIAVIGMSCRFPGDGGTIEGFWDLLSNARTAWSEVPGSRFNVDSHYHPSAERQGAIIARGGYFSKADPGLFDAPFFSMTSTEAAGTDPQQRWLLEVAYEAFENAGIPMKSLVGSQTSCYVGCLNQDYETTTAGNINTTSIYQATGTGLSMLANRLSWFYDLRGPSMVIDTACSSSLVALHLACQSIRSRESSMAIVGGTNMMLEPEPWRGLSTLRFMSPDGKCHSFDAKANGYGRGEGQAVIVLKPLAQALKDGDTIRSVIRGSGINQDGKTSGITVPSSDAQRDLIVSTYAAAGIGMDRTNYFEAHGTGTPVGDPLELAAVGAAMAVSRSGKNPLLVGSVKPNIGHLEGCAGLAGVIKSILSMEQGFIPAVAEFTALNPRLKLSEWGVAIPNELTPWPPGLRRVSVNSFGYGGTNAHTILDDAYHYLKERNLEGNHVTLAETPYDTNDSGSDSALGSETIEDAFMKPETLLADPITYMLFSFSTPNQGGASRLKASYEQYLERKVEEGTVLLDEPEFLRSFSYTLNARRTVFDWRTFIVADSMASLAEKIKGGFPKLPRALKAPACGFVFTGQGAQWYAMGRELQTQPVFLSTLTAADRYITTLGCAWSVLTEMNASESESRISEPQISQTLCTILQIALVDLLSFWGVHPKAVVGHSSGEIAAAFSAGFLTREDAWKIAYFRGIVSASMKTLYPDLHGTMTAVALEETAALGYLKPTSQGAACVACINSPSSVTLSGDESAISEIEERLKLNGVWYRRLNVGVAYHSQHMKNVAEDYLNSIRDVKPITPEKVHVTTMFSSLTGSAILSSTELGPTYWVQNMVNPVRFSTAVMNMLKPTDARSKRQRMPNVNSLVEIGPHSALQGPLNQILISTPEGYDKSVTYTAMIRRQQDGIQTVLETAGKLWCLGHSVDLGRVNTSTASKPGRVLVDLPCYPWNHDQRHWFDSRIGAESKHITSPRTDLLGLRDPAFNHLEPRWYNYLKPLEIPWVLDHKIQGAILLPAAAMMAMAVEAMGQLADEHKSIDSFEMKNVRFHRALMFQSPDHVVQTSFQIRSYKTSDTASLTSWSQFALFSANQGNYVEHCHGLIRINYTAKKSEIEKGLEAEAEWESRKADYAATKSASDHKVDTDELYHLFLNKGFDFGPTFRNLDNMYAGINQGCATITIPDTKAIMPENVEFPLVVHPTTLDSTLQLIISGHMRTPGNMEKVPTFVESIVISNSIPSTPGTVLHGFCTIQNPTDENISASVILSDEQFSKPLLCYIGMKCASPARAHDSDQSTEELSKVCSLLQWVEDVETLTTVSAQSMDIVGWFDMAGYKHPGLRILEIGSDSVATTISVVGSLSEKDGLPARFSKYTYTKPTQDELLRARETLKPWSSVDFAILDSRVDVSSQGFLDGQYDIIFCTGIQEEQCKEIMKAAKKLLTTGGKLVVRMIASPDGDDVLPSSQLDTSLRSQGFSGVEVIINGPDNQPILFSSSDSPKLFDVQDIVIIAPDERSEALQKLLSRVSKGLGFRSLTAREASLESIDSFKDTLFVSFAEFNSSSLYAMSENVFQQVKDLLTMSAGVLWVTNSDLKEGSLNPNAGIATGLFRTIRTEAPHLRLANLDLSRDLDLGSDSASTLIMYVLDKMFAIDNSGMSLEGADKEFVEADGRLYIPRVLPETSINSEITKLDAAPRPQPEKLFQPGRPLKLEMKEPGLLDTGRFIDQEMFLEPLPADCVEIRVNAVGVNFLDLMIALGQTPNSLKGFGSEIVGVIQIVGPDVDPKFKVGDTVVAIATEAFATHVRLADEALQHLPSGMSEVEAVGCVISYITAYSCLVDLAKLTKGESVLIHAAAGGVGQAAIQMAQHIGAEVYATVGTTEKKSLLMDYYNIDEDHIFYSRDLTFVKGIMRQTEGKGVDVVLNSMHGEGLLESWNCVADFGRFVEISKRDVFQNSGLEMKNFARNCQFIGFNLQQMESGGKYWRKAFQALDKVFDLLREKKIQPLFPTTVYPFSQFEDALRALQSGNVCGKLVLQAGSDEIVPVMPRAIAAPTLDPNSTFVLVGGLGGLGKALATFLVSQGARYLAFISRSGAASDQSKEFLKSLEEEGVRATALACDISNIEQLRTVLGELSMPKIKGVIQCAMVLRDSIFDNMTYEDWKISTAAKIEGSWNLHEVLPKDMEFFILLSSASGIIGNTGQANYAAGCTYQDQLAHFRRRQGLAATSIDLGAVLGVGYIAETENHKMQEALLDAMHIKEQEVYAVISAAIRTEVPAQILTGIASGDKLRGLYEKYTWPRDPKFSILRRMGGKEVTKGVDGIRAAIIGAMTPAEAAGVLEDALVNRLAKALAISSEDINVSQPMHTYGVDSLVALEIRNWLIKELQADISVFDILGTIPISALSVKIVETSKLLVKKFNSGEEEKLMEMKVEVVEIAAVEMVD